MLISTTVAVFYLLKSTLFVFINCQSDQYTVRKTKFDNPPNEQPMVLISKNGFRLAIPELLNNIPQVSSQPNEKLVLACPETSRLPGEIVPSISSLATATGTQSSTNPSSSTISTHENPILSTSDLSVSNTRTGRFTPGTNDQQKVIEEKVTKKTGKFYISKDINFSWELTKLTCERPALVIISELKKECQEGGEIYEIGFKIRVRGPKIAFASFANAFHRALNNQELNKEYLWIPCFTVCYNMDLKRPIYTKHTLFGKAVKAAAKLMLHPDIFDHEEPFQPFNNVDLASYYEKKNQYKIFESILGKNIAFIYNDTVSKYLIPVQLVPPAEMPLPVLTLSTFSFMNTTPGWEVVALRNWKKLENTVQYFADEEKLDLVIYSGTANILQLPNEEGEMKEIYLDYQEKSVFVAASYYKLVYDEPSKRAIVFFTHNNPYKVSSSDNQFCPDICEKTGWWNETWKDLDRGYTSCCDYNIVKEKFTFLPQITVEEILITAESRTSSKIPLFGSQESLIMRSTSMPIASESDSESPQITAN